MTSITLTEISFEETIKALRNINNESNIDDIKQTTNCKCEHDQTKSTSYPYHKAKLKSNNYNKLWKKLTMSQKNILLQKYLNAVYEKYKLNNLEFNHLTYILNIGLTKKTLDVNYDKITSSIKNINNLFYENNKYIIKNIENNICNSDLLIID